MKCEVIRDLLFLYEEDGCSKESRKLVEEHLKGCEACRAYQKKMRFPEDMVLKEPQISIVEETKPKKKIRDEETILKKSFRKIRRRWAVSLVIVLLIFPCIGLGIMGWNEYRQEEGICFTNLDELYHGYQFMNLMKDGKYEQAVEMITYENSYLSIQQALEDAEKPFNLYQGWSTFTANNETWVVDDWMSFYSLEQWEQNKEEDVWRYLIYNNFTNEGIMVPESVWNEVIGVENMQEYINNDVKGYAPNDIDMETDAAVFCLMKTEWGNYYVSNNLARAMQKKGTLSAREIVLYANMIPEIILQAAEEELKAEHDRNAASTQKYYAEVKDMSCEQFSELMKQKFITNVRAFEENGSSFEILRFRYMMKQTERWEVCFDLKETYADGSQWEYTLRINIENETIVGFSISHASSQDYREKDSLAKAMQVMYWNGVESE